MKQTVDRRFFVGGLSAAALLAVFPARAAKVKPGADAALIVVDVQNCFVTGGTLPVKGGEEVVPVINKIAGGFKNIVVTQDWHTPGHTSFASSHSGKKPFETTKLAYGTQVLWPDHCVQGSDDAALHKDLKLPTAQLVIRKGYNKGVDSYSAFMEADGKTVTGLATDFCVSWTAQDARKAGFNVYVIEDATRAIDLNGSLAAAWKAMTEKGVKRIQSGDIEMAA
jgi:nicotinamidase/pyrazinamidase